MVGEGGAERRVRGQVEVIPLEGGAGSAEGHGGNVGQGGPEAEEMRLLLQRPGRRLPEGREVVEDVEPTAEGGRHQVPFPGLDRQVLHGDGGQARELGPAPAGVQAEEEAELRAAVEQTLPGGILPQGVDGAALRQVGRDGLPGAPAVPAAQEVGPEVAGLVGIEGRVERVGLVGAGAEAGDVGLVGDAREPIRLPPGLASVLAHLQ